jgi:hypothetical protein
MNSDIKKRINEINTEKQKMSDKLNKCEFIDKKKDCTKIYNKYLIYLVKWNALTGNGFLSYDDLKEIKKKNLNKELKKLDKEIDKKIIEISKQKTILAKNLLSNIADCNKKNKCPESFEGFEKAMKCEAKFCEKQSKAIIKFNEEYKKQFGFDKIPFYRNKFIK